MGPRPGARMVRRKTTAALAGTGRIHLRCTQPGLVQAAGDARFHRPPGSRRGLCSLPDPPPGTVSRSCEGARAAQGAPGRFAIHPIERPERSLGKLECRYAFMLDEHKFELH